MFEVKKPHIPWYLTKCDLCSKRILSSIFCKGVPCVDCGEIAFGFICSNCYSKWLKLKIKNEHFDNQTYYRSFKNRNKKQIR
jgi:hypothetical protein